VDASRSGRNCPRAKRSRRSPARPSKQLDRKEHSSHGALCAVERPKQGQALLELQVPERVRDVMVKAEGRSTAVTRLFSGELFRRGSGAA
jgi:hypothetical protein